MVRVFAACFCLIAANAAVPTTSGAASKQSINSEQRIQPGPEPIVLAQRGRCKAFGETNKCRPIWDNRSKSCVCAGA